MISSEQLSAMMQDFERSNGPVETIPILQRDYSHPTREGFMLPSANDAPKLYKEKTKRASRAKPKDEHKPRSSALRDKAIEHIKQNPHATTVELANALGVSTQTVRNAAALIGHRLTKQQRGQPPSPQYDKAVAYMARNKGKTTQQIMKATATSEITVRKAIRSTGYKPGKPIGIAEAAILKLGREVTAKLTARQVAAKVRCIEKTALNVLIRHKMPFAQRKSVTE